MVVNSIHSPRRSPRLSDTTSPNRQSPRTIAQQRSATAAAAKSKSRSSIGGASSAARGNDASLSPSNGRGNPKARRAQSLGGELLKKAENDKNNTLSIVTSRRNVPGPRKSAIRAAPPQVFASPPLIPSKPFIVTRSAASVDDGLSAIGGSDLMELMSSLESSKSVSTQSSASPSHGGGKGRKSSAQADHSLRREDDEVDNTIARRKRRVTFNPYQERNDFDWQEPTLSIRPSGEAELVTAGGNSSSGSEDSSNMSLDSDDSNAQSDDAEEASMEITEAYNGGTYRSDLQSDISDSTMDITQAFGGVLDATTRTLLPSGDEEEVDGMSASEGEESMSIDQSPRRDNGDATVTMQFTSVYDDKNENDSTSRLEDEDTEDAEVDMQLTEIAEEGEISMTTTDNPPQDNDNHEDSSLMELTATFSPEKSAIIDRSSMQSPSTPRRSPRYSMPHSSSPKKGHEYCHVPAAESPKQHLSAATQKAIARRQSLAKGQSPVKKIASPLKRPSLGVALKKTPDEPSTAASSDPVKSLDSRKSLPVKTEEPARASPTQSRRSASPLKVPTTPSRVWQSFRKSYGATSPVKPSASGPQSPIRNSLGSPQRIKVKSAKQALQAVDVAAIEPESRTEEKVTMKQFFDSINFSFLDISMPSKRRIQRDSPIKEEAGLTESLKAACGSVPSLDSLINACVELKNTVDEGRTIALDCAQEFYENPPSYVVDVKSMTSESERQKIISAFRLQKAAARAVTLQTYYAWRVEKQFDDDALRKWQSVREKLEADVQIVNAKTHAVQEEVLPTLRKRHQQLKEEVERERKRQKQIKEGDAEELGELQRLIEEQGQMLADQQRVHEVSTSELASLQSEVQSNARKTRALEESIAQNTQDYQAIQKCTQEEASRLARHIQQLEQLHLWRIHSATVDRIIVELGDTVVVTLNLCGKSVSRIDVLVDGDATIQTVLQEAVEKHLATLQAATAQPADLVRFVGTTWTRLQHLHGIYNALVAHYPTDMSLARGDHEEGNMTIRASVLLPQQRSKLVVEIRCRLSRLADVRSPLFELGDISAKCIYGPVGSSLAMQITNGLNTDTSAIDFVRVISQVINMQA